MYNYIKFMLDINVHCVYIAGTRIYVCDLITLKHTM